MDPLAHQSQRRGARTLAAYDTSREAVFQGLTGETRPFSPVRKPAAQSLPAAAGAAGGGLYAGGPAEVAQFTLEAT